MKCDALHLGRARDSKKQRTRNREKRFCPFEHPPSTTTTTERKKERKKGRSRVVPQALVFHVRTLVAALLGRGRGGLLDRGAAEVEVAVVGVEIFSFRGFRREVEIDGFRRRALLSLKGHGNEIGALFW